MSFRKKPVVIEAEQIQATDAGRALPFWGEAEYRAHGMIGAEIKTLEGWYEIHEGDWIIKGVKGEFYPCKPDIFEMTYELPD